MEFRRVCDSIIRSPSSSLLYFLTPSIPRKPYTPILFSQSTKPSIRAFSNGSQHFQSSAAAAAKEPEDELSSLPKESSTDAILDSLARNRTSTSTRPTSRFSPLRAQEANRPGISGSPTAESQSREPRLEDSIKSDPNLVSLLDDIPKPARRPFDSQRSRDPSLPPRDSSNLSSSTDVFNAFNSSRNRSSRPSSIDISKMLSPTSTSPSSDLLRSNEPPPPPPVPTLRLGPSTGRSVQIDNSRGMDLGKGLKTLDLNCARNNVRNDFNRQRFHERGGLKRKRLHSVRWRKRFKLGFKAVVQKVADMRRKGW
ncbi:MAG: hypothetical protein M1812_003022 [Candelaria pacifica]|nr:MAG: hypothetical protein M1812_003022 [Candelaria pacifica]